MHLVSELCTTVGTSTTYGFLGQDQKFPGRQGLPQKEWNYSVILTRNWSSVS